jgi:hypothetical protein
MSTFTYGERLKNTDYKLYCRLQHRISEKDIEDVYKHALSWLVWDTFFKGSMLSLVPFGWVVKGLEKGSQMLEGFLDGWKAGQPVRVYPKPAATKLHPDAYAEAASTGMCWCRVCRDFTHDDPFEPCPACAELVWPAVHALELDFIKVEQ